MLQQWFQSRRYMRRGGLSLPNKTATVQILPAFQEL
jgi:hypothetical protein